MCGLAGIMIITQYVGILFIVFYAYKLFKFNDDRIKMMLAPQQKEEVNSDYKVLAPVDQSIVIEKHTLLAKINKMINVCGEQLKQITLSSKKDYYTKRELSAVIKSYEEIRKIEINDRITLDYATFLFNDGKLRNKSEIQLYDERIEQAKYVSSGEFYKEMAECNEQDYLSRRLIAGSLMFLTGFLPSCFYGLIEDSFWSGFFTWQKNILHCAFNPFENGALGEGLRLFVILPFIFTAPFFIGAGILIHASLEIRHNMQENVYRKKAGFKSEINTNTIIAGVACIPTLVKILKGGC